MNTPTLNKKLIISREISYSPILVRTPNMNYYQVKEQMPAGYRMSTAEEEHALQRPYEIVANILRGIKDEKDVVGKSPDNLKKVLEAYAETFEEKMAIQYVFETEAKPIQNAANAGVVLIPDPKNAKAFDDVFARNKDKTYVWQWTETGLRVPKGWEEGRYQTNSKGDKEFPRIILIGNREAGEKLIPEGDGRLITAWYEDYSLPRVTKDISWPHKGYTTHFTFNTNPDKDNISGHHDVAGGRVSYWPTVEDVGCLCVDAYHRRSVALSAGGFRPVQDLKIKIIK